MASGPGADHFQLPCLTEAMRWSAQGLMAKASLGSSFQPQSELLADRFALAGPFFRPISVTIIPGFRFCEEKRRGDRYSEVV